MFDNCYFDYYGKTKSNLYGQGVVSKIELWIDDNQSPMRKVGTVFSEGCSGIISWRQTIAVQMELL